MNLKCFIPLCFLLLLLGACSDDAERASLPEVFEAQSIDYFFAEGGVRMYEEEVCHRTLNNYTASTNALIANPYAEAYQQITFTSNDPAAFDWLAEGDTAWVADIALINGVPEINTVSQIPYRKGITLLPNTTSITATIEVPPHTSVSIYYTVTYLSVTASYVLDLEDPASGATREVRGRMTKAWPIQLSGPTVTVEELE